ncbi:MAG: hypothetical protein LCH37_01940 [Bacteroidetes bacterium]|nr:hypothetical protein [Bacteroidota bacterium]MCK6610042.1 hypothetical protein [Bacteroidia bacterium]
MEFREKAIEKPLECPIPHKERKGMMVWIKRLGIWGFLFFLIKGIAWLVVLFVIPYLISKGIISK